jgi:hypothetical protein
LALGFGEFAGTPWWRLVYQIRMLYFGEYQVN